MRLNSNVMEHMSSYRLLAEYLCEAHFYLIFSYLDLIRKILHRPKSLFILFSSLQQEFNLFALVTIFGSRAEYLLTANT